MHLFHAPGLVEHGSKPARDLAAGLVKHDDLARAYRGFDDALAYAPNQVCIGNLSPDELAAHPRPWFEHPVVGGHTGRFGALFGERILLALIYALDEFDLVRLAGEQLGALREALTDHLTHGGPATAGDLERFDARVRAGHVGVPDGRAIALRLGCGEIAGWVRTDHDDDPSITPDVLLENMVTKITGGLALRQVLAAPGMGTGGARIGYVIGCGEEAVGDRYQRGGGNMGKTFAEVAGIAEATGSDVKAFCCAPIHALVIAGALVTTGVFDEVAVVGGASLAKLGMKYRGHLAHGQPILEDVLASIAMVIGRPNGRDAELRLDAVGRHTVSAGSAAAAIYQKLVFELLERAEIPFGSVDRFAVELHNPELTEPAGSGNVPLTNYKMLASLAAQRGLLERPAMAQFVARHGLVGFAPTQGHIPSAVPYLGWAKDAIESGAMRRAMFLGKGSLFLGRMTKLADGMSVILEAPA